MKKLKKSFSFFVILISTAVISGCGGGLSNIRLGGVGSSLQNNIFTCPESFGTVSIGGGNQQGAQMAQLTQMQANFMKGHGSLSTYGLSSDATPLLSLILSKTKCVELVNRGAGLDAAMREQALAESGMTKASVSKGQIVAADYLIELEISLLAQNADGLTAGKVAEQIGSTLFAPLGIITDTVVGKTKFSEARARLKATDLRTGSHIASVEGSASRGDIGLGGDLLGDTSVDGWGKTSEEKVVAAAILDAVNKLMPKMQQGH